MSSLPKLGAHALTLRGAFVQKADDNAAQTIMQPASKDYAALAGEAAEHQVGSRCICTARLLLLISLACCPCWRCCCALGSSWICIPAVQMRTLGVSGTSGTSLHRHAWSMGCMSTASAAASCNAAVAAADLSCPFQVCIDLFVMARQSCDLATLGTLCKGTCGQLCHYFPWDARLDADQLENDLRWNLQRPQVVEAWAWSAACQMRPLIKPVGAAALSAEDVGALQLAQNVLLACHMLTAGHSDGCGNDGCMRHMCCMPERCWHVYMRGGQLLPGQNVPPGFTASPVILWQCLQGLEALARLRCSRGLSVAGYFGSFHRRGPTDIDMPSINSDQSIAVQLRLDEKLQEGVEAYLQFALLYTSTSGQRLVR